MTRRTVVGLALVALALAAGTERAARAETVASPPDLTGEWRLDAAHSDLPRPPGGGDARSGRGGGGAGMGGRRGGWGGGGGGFGRGGTGGGRGAGGMEGGRGGGRDAGQDAANRPRRLPDLMHITQTPELVSCEDSTGAVAVEIATVPAAADTFVRAPGAQHVLGTWRGEVLEVDRPGRGGGTMTETYSLVDQGRTLVIDAKLPAADARPALEFKRVYHRVTES